MTNNDPRSLLATSPMGVLQIVVCTITAFLNALDGFDLLAISFATPGIMKEFHIEPSVGLGLVLAMDLWGMAVGSFLLGGLADYIGRRRSILIFLVVMAIGMFLCSHADSREQLAAWRFFTGLGIGGMLAAINATAAEFSNEHMRRFWLALMTIGYPLGNILAAFILSPLLKTHDWRIVFELGAGATAAMIPVVWLLVPESVSWLCRRQPANALSRINASLKRMGHAVIDALPPLSVGPVRAPLADVFKARYLALTLLLVFAYFAHITSFYYILKWVAPIISKLGYSPSNIADVLFWVSVGGAAGGALLGALCAAHESHLAHQQCDVAGHDLDIDLWNGPEQSWRAQAHRRDLRLLHQCRHRGAVHPAGARLSHASARHGNRRGDRRRPRRRGARTHPRGLPVPARPVPAGRFHHHGLRLVAGRRRAAVREVREHLGSDTGRRRYASFKALIAFSLRISGWTSGLKPASAKSFIQRSGVISGKSEPNSILCFSCEFA